MYENIFYLFLYTIWYLGIIQSLTFIYTLIIYSFVHLYKRKKSRIFILSLINKIKQIYPLFLKSASKMLHLVGKHWAVILNFGQVLAITNHSLDLPLKKMFLFSILIFSKIFLLYSEKENFSDIWRKFTNIYCKLVVL